MKLAIRIWRQTFETLAKNPVILLPFFIIGLFDVISLILIYLSPQPPFSALFAPPIRAFWGEQFLHYPFNLLLIPRLFSYVHIVTAAIIGVVMSGLVIGMLKDARAGEKPRILHNFIYALSRYFAILAIWLIMFMLGFLVYKLPSFFIPVNNRAIVQIAFYLSFLIVVFIEVVFIYAIPAAIIEKKGLISALKRGVLFSKNNFLIKFSFGSKIIL